jgi:hypothetical protein
MKGSDDSNVRAPQDDWQADWEGHRRWQLTAALAATPAQRLEWLEAMINFACRAIRETRKEPNERS